MPSISKEKPNKSTSSKVGKSVKLTGTILDKIVPVGEVERYFKLALYGRSGSGKTRFACSFPKPLLIIGAEDGTLSVRGDKGVEFFPLEKSEELVTLQTVYSNYATIVLDTATMLQDLILKEILGLEEIPVQKSWGMAKRDEYSQCGIKTKEFLRRMLEAKCHTVIISQEKEYDVKESLPDLIVPYVGSALQPSTANWLHPSCDFVLQNFVRGRVERKEIKIGKTVQESFETTDEPEYCLRTTPHPVYLSKVRTPRGKEIRDVIVDPTFEKFEELVHG